MNSFAASPVNSFVASPLNSRGSLRQPPFVEYQPTGFLPQTYPPGLLGLPDGAPGYPYFTTIRHPYHPVGGPDYNDLTSPQLGVYIPFGNPLPPEFMPITWHIVDGSLPPGMNLVDSDPTDNLVEFAGTPTTLGTFPVTIAARDRFGRFLSTSAFGTFWPYQIAIKRPLQVVNYAELKTFLQTFIGDPIIGDIPGWDVSNGGILLPQTSVVFDLSAVGPVNYKGGWLGCKAYHALLPDGYFSVFDDRSGTDIGGVGPVWTKSPGDIHDLAGDYSFFSGSTAFTGSPPPMITLTYI